MRNDTRKVKDKVSLRTNRVSVAILPTVFPFSSLRANVMSVAILATVKPRYHKDTKARKNTDGPIYITNKSLRSVKRTLSSAIKKFKKEWEKR